MGLFIVRVGEFLGGRLVLLRNLGHGLIIGKMKGKSECDLIGLYAQVNGGAHSIDLNVSMWRKKPLIIVFSCWILIQLLKGGKECSFLIEDG